MKLLTYNVLWETIQNKTNLSNITQAIDAMGKYDFIAIQEVVSVSDLQKNSKNLNKMGYVFTKHGSSRLLTFFNKEKYDILAVHHGGIIYNKKGGRPFHIIYAMRKEDQQRFMVINIHMPHLNSDQEIESVITKQLSRNFDEGFDNKKKLTEIDLVYKSFSSKNLSHYLKDHHYLGIFMGDTNDHQIINMWRGFNPIQSKFHYQKVQYPNLDSIIVSSQNEKAPPNTCCLGIDRSNPYQVNFYGKYTSSGYGDYILIDMNLNIETHNRVPPSFKKYINFETYPTSDHLPVELEIKIENKKTKSPSSLKLKKKNKGFQLGNFYCEMVNI